jgi:hypothetical protein
MSVTRVDLKGNCPNGTVACSNMTNANDTICYPKADVKEKCPVNALKFVPASDSANYTATGYITAKFND